MSRGKNTLRHRLRHVYWIGGGSGAGKSTVARRIAAEFGMQVYATDDVMAEHARRSTSQACPLLHEFITMDMDERWVKRTPSAMFETFHWFRGEAFNMIVEDLLRLPVSTPMIVEGLRVLPYLVKPVLSGSNHGVWLLPTPAFRKSVFERRGGQDAGFLAKTSDPERALQNVLERDKMFTDSLRHELNRLQLPALDVDITTTEQDSTEQVIELFGL